MPCTSIFIGHSPGDCQCYLGLGTTCPTYIGVFSADFYGKSVVIALAGTKYIMRGDACAFNYYI